MCKKHTSVSHSSTESEAISLDAGLRMGGIPALDLWDVVIEVLHSSKNTHQAVRYHCREEMVDDQVPRSRERSEIQSTKANTKSKRNSNRDVDEVSNMDHVVTSADASHFDSQLYTFEDNEAVIKMIIMGRSPMMRYVSRNHTVALDWVFDRIILEPKIQIKYVDTTNQLVDMLTKGNFRRDEWSHLLSLLNIVNFSMFSCRHFVSIFQPNIREEVQDKSLWWRNRGQ